MKSKTLTLRCQEPTLHVTALMSDDGLRQIARHFQISEFSETEPVAQIISVIPSHPCPEKTHLNAPYSTNISTCTDTGQRSGEAGCTFQRLWQPLCTALRKEDVASLPDRHCEGWRGHSVDLLAPVSRYMQTNCGRLGIPSHTLRWRIAFCQYPPFSTSG